MTTTKHTPTPLHVGHYASDIFAADGHIYATATSDEDGNHSEERAAHIVACVNAHAALVAALRTIDALSNAPTRHVDDYGGDIARTALRDTGIAESGVAE